MFRFFDILRRRKQRPNAGDIEGVCIHGEHQSMATLDTSPLTDLQIILERDKNHRFIDGNWEDIETRYVGKFIVVYHGEVKGAFVSQRKARDYCDSLGPDFDTAVIWFVDDPEEAYAI